MIISFFLIFVPIDGWTDATDSGKHVVPPHRLPAKSSLCCARLPLHPLSWGPCLSQLMQGTLLSFTYWSLVPMHYCDILHVGCFTVRCRLWALARMHAHSRGDVIVSPARWVLSSFLFVFHSIVVATRFLVLTTHWVSGVTYRFKSGFRARVEHELRRSGCETIRSGQLPPTLCCIQAFGCGWTVQQIRYNYTFSLLFLRHWCFRIHYCAVSYTAIVPLEPKGRIQDQGCEFNLPFSSK